VNVVTAIRGGPRAGDREAVLRIVRSSGFFTDAEQQVALELVDERMGKGDASGYRFLFAVIGDETDPVGYACFGPIAGTRSSFDLYWIAVDAAQRGRGVGTALMDAVIREAGAAGATRLYAETSSREQYEPTRRFYESRGFARAALLPDFYAPGDGKLIYWLALESESGQRTSR